MKKICGIYKIINKINNKIYIGQSIDIIKRWYVHIGTKSNSIIHKAIEKYGKDKFTFEVIEECDFEKLNEREIYWISFYDSFVKGYNLTIGGDGCKDREITQEHKNKISEKLKNRIFSEEHKRKLSESKKNQSEETRIKNSKSKQKKVCQMDSNDTVINTYDSITEASEKTGINRRSISSVCLGKRMQTGGYKWKYVPDDLTI